MNAKQRNQNRDTATNLKFSTMQWNSRNRKLIPVQPQFVKFPNGIQGPAGNPAQVQ